MKKNIHKICFVLAAALTLGFVIKLIIDYSVYTSTLNSAPFYLLIIIDGLCFLLPAAIILVVGLVIKRKAK